MTSSTKPSISALFSRNKQGGNTKSRSDVAAQIASFENVFERNVYVFELNDLSVHLDGAYRLHQLAASEGKVVDLAEVTQLIQSATACIQRLRDEQRLAIRDNIKKSFKIDVAAIADDFQKSAVRLKEPSPVHMDKLRLSAPQHAHSA